MISKISTFHHSSPLVLVSAHYVLLLGVSFKMNVSYMFRIALRGLTLAAPATTQSSNRQSGNSECIPITGSAYKEIDLRNKEAEALSRERSARGQSGEKRERHSKRSATRPVAGSASTQNAIRVPKSSHWTRLWRLSKSNAYTQREDKMHTCLVGISYIQCLVH